MILIFGGSGQLGTELHNSATCEFLSPSSSECDVTDYKSLTSYMDATANIELIINTAAYTDVAGAEREQSEAEKLNTTAVANIVRQCRQRNIPFIQISTDFVFDGQKRGGYTETDKTNPVNIYGKTKKDAEEIISSQLQKFIILRTSWLIGSNGKNFLKTILHVAREKEQLDVVNDQTGGPTPTKALAAAVWSIAGKMINEPETVEYGIYHYAGTPTCSWFDLASEIVEQGKEMEKIPPSVKLKPTTSAAYAATVKRPQNSQLDCSKIKEKFGIEQPNWKDGIKETIAVLYPSA